MKMKVFLWKMPGTGKLLGVVKANSEEEAIRKVARAMDRSPEVVKNNYIFGKAPIEVIQ